MCAGHRFAAHRCKTEVIPGKSTIGEGSADCRILLDGRGTRLDRHKGFKYTGDAHAAIKWPKLFIAIRFCGIGIVLMVVVYFLYMRAIVEIAGTDVPTDWSSRLGEMSFDEINKKIGPPQDDASAKQYQNLIEYHWWGVKMLKITARDCCKPTTRPYEIYYIVYAKGQYAPVYHETIFRSDH